MTVLIFFTDNKVKVFTEIKKIVENNPLDYILIDYSDLKTIIPRKNVHYIQIE